MEGSRHSLRLKSQAKKEAKRGGKEQQTSRWKGKLQTKRKQRSSSPVDPPHAEKKMKSISFLFGSPRMGFEIGETMILVWLFVEIGCMSSRISRWASHIMGLENLNHRFGIWDDIFRVILVKFEWKIVFVIWRYFLVLSVVQCLE